MTKVLVLSVCFFFVGLANISAQYMGPNDATLMLKTELETLENDLPNASTNAAKEDIAFKYRYFKAVLEDISSGNEVGAAIHDNAPTNKPKVHSSGLIAFTADVPDFKQQVIDIVEDLDNLLSE